MCQNSLRITTHSIHILWTQGKGNTITRCFKPHTHTFHGEISGLLHILFPGLFPVFFSGPKPFIAGLSRPVNFNLYILWLSTVCTRILGASTENTQPACRYFRNTTPVTHYWAEITQYDKRSDCIAK